MYALTSTILRINDLMESLDADFIMYRLRRDIIDSNPDDVIRFAVLIQKIYDTKIDINNLIKSTILPEATHTKLFVDIFTISIVADRVNYFCDLIFNSLDLNLRQKKLIFFSILHELKDNLYFYKPFRNSFNIQFINIQLEMLQVVSVSKVEDNISKTARIRDLFFINKDIKGFKDLYNIYNSSNFPKFDSRVSSFMEFLTSDNIQIRPNIYKYFILSKEEVEFINGQSISAELLNKVPIDDIENLLLLDKKYLITEIYLKEETIKKMDSEILNKYLERFVADSYMGYWGSGVISLEKILEFIPLESMTEQIIKKYYRLFFERCNLTFQKRILENRFNLKSMLTILEECV